MKKLQRQLNWPLSLQLARVEEKSGQPTERKAAFMKDYNGLGLCQPCDFPISKMVDYDKLFNNE